MAPHTGKVRIHAVTISNVTPQRTAENRLVAPTPTMAVLIVCVVLKGMPNRVANSIVKAAGGSAANRDGIGWVSRSPIVLRWQPPRHAESHGQGAH